MGKTTVFRESGRRSGGDNTLTAIRLGLESQTESLWPIPNSFDKEFIYSGCYNLAAEWLLTGNVVKLHGQTTLFTLPPDQPAYEKILLI